MELNLIEEIKKIGLDNFVSKYSLSKKDYGHKFSLKYDQLDTPKNRFTNECRGIVISKDLEVLSLPLVRFGNYEQNSRKKIDWESAKYYEKTDGSMIQYYWDEFSNKWCVGTTGTGEAVDNVVHRDKIKQTRIEYDFSVSYLFYNTCKENNIDLSSLVKGNTYIFEMATICNIVINSYENSRIVLIGARNLTTFDEYNYLELAIVADIIGCELPKEYRFESEEDMMKSLDNVKYGDINFEGYVIVDKNFNRLKVKSNIYIIFSQFNGDIESKWRLADIILNNEIEEVIISFPTLKDQLYKMKAKYDKIIFGVKDVFFDLKANYDSLDKKDIYMAGQKSINYEKKKRPILGIFTALVNDKDVTWEEAVKNIKGKSLYKILK